MKFLRHFQSPLLDIAFWISHVVGTMECLTLVMLCDSGSLDQSNHDEDNSKVPHRGKESKRHQVEILVEWEVWFRWSLCHIYIFHLQIVVLGNYSIVSQVSSTCLFRAVPMRRSFTLSVQRCTSVSWLLRRMSPPLSPVHVADASDDLPDEAVESPMAPCMQTL